MSSFPSQAIKYVAWQNRATEFYVAARELYLLELHWPSVYSATMSLELLLKGTLTYWDKSFEPREAGHGMAKLCRMVGNKVKGAKGFKIPGYFYFDERYLSVSRYPRAKTGLGIPSSFLADLDSSFVKLISMVPFQHNTSLKRILGGRKTAQLRALARANNCVRALRRVLSVRAA
jgi:hypothetical protein